MTLAPARQTNGSKAIGRVALWLFVQEDDDRPLPEAGDLGGANYLGPQGRK